MTTNPSYSDAGKELHVMRIKQLESEIKRLQGIIERSKAAVNLIEPYVEPKYNLKTLNEILNEASQNGEKT